MTSSEIRKKYLEFFEKRGHKIIPSASLIPEKDSTTLFTGSGMQPLLPYLLGKEHPLGKRLANSQRCFRAEDIDEVGDNRHTTFFEMLGNWSLGDYFKKEQLRWFFEYLTKEVGLKPEKLYATVFAGDEKNKIPRDEESADIWKKLFKEKGIEAKGTEILTIERGAELGMQGARIFYYDSAKNWWSRVGTPDKMPAREPGGPDSEVFYEFEAVPHNPKFGKNCHPNCNCGRFMEIGNSVFMEYVKKEDGSFEKLAQRNVDFGGGLERITAASNDDPDMFHIDTFRQMAKGFGGLGIPIASPEEVRRSRVALDHLRASMYLIGEGIEPSNKDRGYVLRRLLRRAIYHAVSLASGAARIPLGQRPQPPPSWNDIMHIAIHAIVDKTIEASPSDVKSNLVAKQENIHSIITKEEGKFIDLLKSSKGLRDIITSLQGKGEKEISGTKAFTLYSTYGIPIDYIRDEAQKYGLKVDELEFENHRKKHQGISRAGAEAKFGGHGLYPHTSGGAGVYLKTGEVTIRDKSEIEKVTRLHTATHLLHQALREALGPEVRQNGSDITVERTRFDFNFPRKLAPEELTQVENLVNQKIKEDLLVSFVELPKAEAEKTGALYFFKEKYPDTVKVYFIGPTIETAWSKEFCGGPHVKHTKEVGRFRIVKEEAVASGLRRIRGVVEP